MIWCGCLEPTALGVIVCYKLQATSFKQKNKIEDLRFKIEDRRLKTGERNRV